MKARGDATRLPFPGIDAATARLFHGPIMRRDQRIHGNTRMSLYADAGGMPQAPSIGSMSCSIAQTRRWSTAS